MGSGRQPGWFTALGRGRRRLASPLERARGPRNRLRGGHSPAQCFHAVFTAEKRQTRSAGLMFYLGSLIIHQGPGPPVVGTMQPSPRGQEALAWLPPGLGLRRPPSAPTQQGGQRGGSAHLLAACSETEAFFTANGTLACLSKWVRVYFGQAQGPTLKGALGRQVDCWAPADTEGLPHGGVLGSFGFWQGTGVSPRGRRTGVQRVAARPCPRGDGRPRLCRPVLDCEGTQCEGICDPRGHQVRPAVVLTAGAKGFPPEPEPWT